MTRQMNSVSVSKPKETAGTLIVEGPSATSKTLKIEKPRLYNSEYLKFGFIFAGSESNPRPQCSVCVDILANETMVPNKLKRHFSTKHNNSLTKPVEYFVKLTKSIKKQSLIFTKKMKISSKAQEASYLVTQIVAKDKEPHTIAETSIKESCCAIVRTMFGPEFEAEVNKIPLADNTIERRIKDMSVDIKQQMKGIFQENSELFALQVNEFTDITGLV